MRPANSTQRRCVVCGWALIEAVITVALLGVMTVGAVSIFEKFARQSRSVDDPQIIEQANLALTGYALAHNNFPAPDDAVPSPGRKGYVEGWLPTSTLSMDSSGKKVRYIVNEQLTHAPALYDPDPARVANSVLPRKTTADVLDLCASLIAQDASAALPGGARAAFGVQLASSATTASAQPVIPNFWVGDSSDPALPAELKFTSGLVGNVELVAQMDCLRRMRRLAALVESVAVTADMIRLLDHQVTLSEIELKQNQDSIVKITWRQASWIVSESTFGVRAVIDMISSKLTVAGAAGGAVAVVGWGLVVGSIADLIAFDDKSLSAAKASLSGAQSAVDTARTAVARAKTQLSLQVSAFDRLLKTAGQE